MVAFYIGKKIHRKGYAFCNIRWSALFVVAFNFLSSFSLIRIKSEHNFFFSFFAVHSQSRNNTSWREVNEQQIL